MERIPVANKYEFCRIHKQVLTYMCLWPSLLTHTQSDTENCSGKRASEKIWSLFKTYLFLWSSLPTNIPLYWDAIAILIEGDDIMELLQPVLALACIMGHHYLAICFLRNNQLIVKIIENLKRMEAFRPFDEIVDVDRKATWFTKMMLFYSTLGTMVYALMPLLPTSMRHCRKTKTPSMIRNSIPCGLACRLRIPFSNRINEHVLSILYILLECHEFYIMICVTSLFITLTMLICSIVMQCVYHFKELRKLIASIDNHDGNHKILIQCIYYHSSIIRLCQDVNDAFGTQMTMFIVLPSFAISLLGFELLNVEFADSIRFGFHLVGWIALLLLVNFGGQLLMDESARVAETAYSIKWYEYKVAFQKDLLMIILRSQEPEYLNASNIRYLSFETFVKVISTAYSYLTMLINIKTEEE